MHKYVFLIALLFIGIGSAQGEVIRPRANDTVTGLFLSNQPNNLNDYFYREQLSVEGGRDSYVLVNYPVSYQDYFSNYPIQGVIQNWGLNLNFNSYIEYTGQWWGSSLGNPIGVVRLDKSWISNHDIYPSFSESPNYPGQCPAFAKIATQEGRGTWSWYAGKNVMERARDVYYTYGGDWTRWWWYIYYDPSPEHRGRMVAYFGWGAQGNNGDTYYSQYPQNTTSSPGHVGIFLKYAYDYWGYPIGFWIADQNYQGNAESWNPDGRIRKHLILVYPIPKQNGGYLLGHTYANNYFFVDIPQ